MGGSPGCGEDVGCIQMICPSCVCACVWLGGGGGRGVIIDVWVILTLPSSLCTSCGVCVYVCVYMCVYMTPFTLGNKMLHRYYIFTPGVICVHAEIWLSSLRHILPSFALDHWIGCWKKKEEAAILRLLVFGLVATSRYPGVSLITLTTWQLHTVVVVVQRFTLKLLLNIASLTGSSGSDQITIWPQCILGTFTPVHMRSTFIWLQTQSPKT